MLIKSDDDLLKKFVPAGLTVKEPTSPYWTTETDFPLAWKVQAEDGVPPGTPMIWATVKRGGEAPLNPELRKALAGRARRIRMPIRSF